MSLLIYLNRYFPNGENGEINDTPVEITAHFLDKFGVNVKKEDNLFLFKYDQLAAKFALPITQECRGMILRHDQKWEIVSHPFSKFFNMGEYYCPITEPEVFNQNINSLQLIEKADGTLIQMWFDNALNKWRVSTGGMISTTTYDSTSNETFEQLFYKTIQSLNVKEMDKGYTYLFELCSWSNRIVTQYDKDIVYLLAMRELNHGLYKTDQEVDLICEEWQRQGSNVKRPEIKFCYELGLTNQDEVRAWVELQKDEPRFGKYPEGFVIYQNGKPIAKVKNTKYMQAFSVSGGNKEHAKNVIVQSIFTGNLDDIYTMLIPELQKFADDVVEKIRKMFEELHEVIKTIPGNDFKTQKDYALFIQKHCRVSAFQSFFYQNKEKLLMGGTGYDGYVLFREWIKKNYMKFDEIWKDKEVK